jgi:hypothetical protein
MKARSKAGSCNTGACVSACCKDQNALSTSGVHFNPSFYKIQVSVSAMAP